MGLMQKRRFSLEQLPSSYLFDESGILIAINPTLEEISIN
jgi:hypothetical protein